MINNILTIDVEDWYSLVKRRVSGELPPASKRVAKQIDRILNLLDMYNVKGTFFVLGSLAEQQPYLVRQVASNGHEIASHGYFHKPIHQLTPEDFREDTQKSKWLLEDIIGSRIKGYRAAEFSITAKTIWALEVLAELGFEYDSSIFPIRHRRYGIPGFHPFIKLYPLRNGLNICEIPLSTISFNNFKLPIAGGGYFRLFPFKFIEYAIDNLNKGQIPYVLYLHPYELDAQDSNSFEFYHPDSLQGLLRSWFINFHQNLGRQGVYGKLEKLLKLCSFTSCIDYLS